MQRVLLQDELAEQFGAVHEYHNLRSPIDAIRLLCINYPEFQKHLIESGKNGVSYKVIQANADLELEDMLLPFGSNDLIITPVITGSGRGAGAIIAGIALIGLAILAPGVGLSTGGFGVVTGAKGLAAAAVAIGGNIGIALTLGGIAQSLAPQPQEIGGFGEASSVYASGPGSITRGSDGRQSYAMTGPVNSVGAGATVPVAYGKTIIGSHIISADIETTDESDPLNTWIRTPTPETMRVNGEYLDFTFKEHSGLRSRRFNSNEFGRITGSCHSHWGGPCLGGPLDVPLGGAEVHLTNIKGEFDEQFPAHRLLMCFRHNSGFYSYISGEGSTRVDGYVTMQISVYNLDGFGRVGQVQITTQGLMSAGQQYQWASQFAYGKIANKDNYAVRIKIIDHNLDTGDPGVSVVQVGYDYLPGSAPQHGF